MKSTIEQNLQQGVAAHKHGKLQDAEHFYRAVLKVDPKNADANHNLGVLALSVSKAEAAIPLFKNALDANPEVEQFWLSYIGALIKENKTSSAQEVLEKAKKRLPYGKKLNDLQFKLNKIALSDANLNSPTSQEQINELLQFYHSDRLHEAEKLALFLIKQSPNNALPWKVLASTLKKLGRMVDSLDAFEKSSQLSPNDAEVHYNLANTLKELNRMDDAAVSYAKAIELQPDLAEAHSNLGLTLKNMGRLEEAILYYKQAIELKPDYAEAYSNLGNTLMSLGKVNEAEVSYSTALAFKPNYAEALNNLGVALQELGNLDKAQATYHRAIELMPDYAEAHSNLGVTLKELGQFDEAVKSYHRAIELMPNNSEFHSRLGVLLQELGRIEEAVFYKQQAFSTRTGIEYPQNDSLAPATTDIFFELTNKCNFHCTFCPSDSQKRSLGFMNLGLVKKLYEENAEKKIATEVNLHLMGEPTLHPELIEILKFGSSKKLKTHLVTNISTLVAKNIPKILENLYGTITASHMTPTKETYHFRGKVGLSWERYVNNLRLLIREYMKRISDGNAAKNNIVIRVMVTQNTASNVSIIGSSKEANDILEEWIDFISEVEQELGMRPFARTDHRSEDITKGNIQSSMSYNLQKGIKLTFWRAFTFANSRVSDDFELEKIGQVSYCSHPFTDVGVLWNGDVTLCCLDHDGQLKVGNIRNSSIETVILSDKAKKLRGSMLGQYPLPSLCQTCQQRPVRKNNVN